MQRVLTINQSASATYIQRARVGTTYIQINATNIQLASATAIEITHHIPTLYIHYESKHNMHRETKNNIHTETKYHIPRESKNNIHTHSTIYIYRERVPLTSREQEQHTYSTTHSLSYIKDNIRRQNQGE